LWYMFFEALNSETERGEIAYSTSIDCVNWSYGSVVLQEPFHLSYPQVFAHNQEIYMLPETRQDGSVRLYRAVEMPNRWECVATLLYGEFADATILHYQDLWWIFAQRGLDEMRLFWSESLTGKWYEHPQNPLWPGDRRRTRPAGRMLFYQGQLLRFAQDGWPSYGSQVRVFAVDHLSKSEYREHELDQSPILEATGTGWNGTAMHHIDAITLEDGRWLAAVDGASLALF
ncbi:MAG: hypothetical protein JNN15_20205, partial [Blastocatellia bacterium]|nr:hypothetical protein [Blastocatellia bacterium]